MGLNDGTSIRLATTRNLTTEETKERILIGLTQPNHGFQTGNVIRNTGSSWVKATADSAINAEVFGIAERIDKDNFLCVMRGRVKGLNGLQAGEIYFLSTITPGVMTLQAPQDSGHVSKPVLLALSSTDGIALDSRGVEITDGAIAANTVGYSPAQADLYDNPTPTLVKTALDQMAQYILPVGAPLPWFSNALPQFGKWIWLNGQEYSRATYSKLFDIYGLNFGSGDGVLTFNVPDLRGRTIFGRANMGGISSNLPAGVDASKTTVGVGGGSFEHILSEAELPAHTHDYSDEHSTGTESSIMGSGGKTARDDVSADDTRTSESTGDGEAHNNMPPFLVGNWITRYE